VPTELYQRHSAGLAATYADIENHALNQDEVLVGTPGAISIRENASGSRFLVRQYYDYEGRKKDQYLASHSDSPRADKLIGEWKRRIEEENDVLKSVRLLVREGYLAATPKQFAALAPLSRHKLFDAGAVLVGTHAFEVMVNRLGIRVAVFSTEDIDIARPNTLVLENVPAGGLLEILRESGIDFVTVPGLGRKDPSTKFKERGRSRFTFDLLVPSSGDEVEIKPVPELSTHATALPYLRYLLGETQTGAALSSHGVLAVRIPVPERFALHKLIVAQLRRGGSEKSLKDLKQAAVLIAALGENHPGALAAAFQSTPVSTRKHLRKSLLQIREQLETHPRAWDEVATVAKP
jgi:hypothetical protein